MPAKGHSKWPEPRSLRMGSQSLEMHPLAETRAYAIATGHSESRNRSPQASASHADVLSAFDTARTKSGKTAVRAKIKLIGKLSPADAAE